jgi:hypothetical protein
MSQQRLKSAWSKNMSWKHMQPLYGVVLAFTETVKAEWGFCISALHASIGKEMRYSLDATSHFYASQLGSLFNFKDAFTF